MHRGFVLAFSLISLFLSGVLGYPQSSKTHLKSRSHERRSSIPTGFVHSGFPHAEEILTMQVSLTPCNISGLEERLWDVSNPNSQNYGKYLSKEEVDDHTRPSKEAMDGIISWLELHGITDITHLRSSGELLSVSLPVSLANEMFSTTFAYYEHTATGSRHIRTMEYYLPDYLTEHVRFIHPTIQFPVIKSRPFKSTSGSSERRALSIRSETSVPSSCGMTYLTPPCIRDLYDFPSDVPYQPGNILGVAAYGGQWFNIADLQVYLELYNPDVNLDNVYIATLEDGQDTQGDPGTEASLDMELAVSLANSSAVGFYSNGDSIGSTTFESDFITALTDTAIYLLELSTDSKPTVFTQSYGIDENAIEYSMANYLCELYAALGSQGVTILTSSMDGGVSGTSSDTTCTEFIATFPATCPYVTSVGATNGIPETAASFSNGGFSNFFPTPSYQSSQVSNYISNLNGEYSGLFNTSGRAYPDIAAYGITAIVMSDTLIEAYGTSVSAPITASLISTINSNLLANGKSTLGFLNPLLYGTLAGSLTDITSGNNPGCGTNGFEATAGWDPVTGLGTPNYNNIVAALGL